MNKLIKFISSWQLWALLAILLVVSFLNSCVAIKYVEDIQFLNSAQAGTAEYFVRVNGSPCKDIDGMIGLCAKRIKTNEVITIHHDPRPYSYMLDIQCSASIDSSFSVPVPANKTYDLKIQPSQFNGSPMFTCIGEIFPDDRTAVSAKWHVRFILVDEKYREREEIDFVTEKKKDYAVMGKYSLYTTYKNKTTKKGGATVVRYDGGPIYSESRNMRFNYGGF